MVTLEVRCAIVTKSENQRTSLSGTGADTSANPGSGETWRCTAQPSAELSFVSSGGAFRVVGRSAQNQKLVPIGFQSRAKKNWRFWRIILSIHYIRSSNEHK